MRSPARLLLLAPLALLAAWGAAGPGQRAQAEDQLHGAITEKRHAVEVVPGVELTTIEVTRTFFNPTFDPEQVVLRVDLPCEAIVDGLELRGPDGARGREVWVPGKLIDPELASERYIDFRFDEDGQALEGDTIAVLSRRYGCAAELELFPVPPLRERSVRYRIQLPSQYERGSYRVELPAFELELEGAEIRLVDPPAGFDLQVDGLAVSAPLQLSGRAPHTLTLTPVELDHTRISLASIDLQALGASVDPQSVFATELDLPARLVELPPVRRVVVVVDASHSLDAHSRSELQQLAAAYLEALANLQPHASAEVLEFDRHVRRVHGEFIDPELAAAELHDAEIESHNGSEPGLALAHARELLREARKPGETGVDWVLLLSDLELRDGYSSNSELEAAAASDVRLHVVQPGYADLPLTPMPHDDPWMAIAQAAGGAYFDYSFEEATLERDGAELLEPNRVWDLRLIHFDTRHRTSDVPLADVIDAGESVQWIDRLAASGVERVAFEAFSWASPLTWSTKPSRAAKQRWAGRLTAGDRDAVGLEDVESKALAELAVAVTPWTSMLAEARFDGPSPTGNVWGIGCGWHGRSIGCSTRCGSGSVQRSALRLDLSILRGAIEQAIAECSGLGRGSVSFEILDREIVAVESTDACVHEAIWRLDLRAWPSFGHPLAQFAFDEGGVHQLQLTALDGASVQD